MYMHMVAIRLLAKSDLKSRATFETETNDYLLLKRKQQKKKKHKSQLEFRWICFSLVIVLAMTES